jgi:hypothetical protein
MYVVIHQLLLIGVCHVKYGGRYRTGQPSVVVSRTTDGVFLPDYPSSLNNRIYLIDSDILMLVACPTGRGQAICLKSLPK